MLDSEATIGGDRRDRVRGAAVQHACGSNAYGGKYTHGRVDPVIGDTTNAVETYGGGRFLYTAPPEPDGTVIVDFNRAYNPPCVFSPYATCPLPWPANRLPIPVEAGERTYDPGH